ncbi:PhzF family phenazine biosynthesis protein [Gemmobacter fulvus]|uniref:PhzF family phenazine biosynthesis protein n=1 Tax=Gemmobacter fulvus TaxID=2840474 RepID=A0A975P835_9RHOB|nr:PhzF family phenazine biosynthesis protein [Gemmobacter fulvus]MBT9244196.1 PhzF family phenazine biosynthesis protein [Gemmobacter fulvus]QWK91097.1 PhzF family phenazine biosynthesis protein [Gemmobacter fulvus]
MTSLQFHTLDVFTATPYCGNPLAVVLGADDLSAQDMQTMAREFNLSETIFVQAPVNPAHTARVRIFFPTAEIPFAGHPTIGCAILLATSTQPEGDFSTEILLEEEAGLVPVRVVRRREEIEAEFTAPVLPSAAPGTAAPELIAQALDLVPQDLGFASHQPGIWQGGPSFLYVPVADLEVLARARPIEPFWSELMDRAGVDSAYLYTPGVECDFQARMFSPTAGIPEDPATGSATAILAAQLRAARVLRPGTQSFTLHQGVEMGRPSTLTLTVDYAAEGITAMRIRGTAVHISQGQMRRP